MNATTLQVGLEMVARRSWSYVLSGTKRALVTEIRLTNKGADSTSGILLTPRVSIDAPTPTPVADPWIGPPLPLPRPRSADKEEPVIWSSVRLIWNPAILGRLEERVEAMLRVDLLSESGDVVASISQPLTLLAPQEWWVLGPDAHELLAAYVRPNSDALLPILNRAREILSDKTGDGSTNGYQSAGLHMLSELGRPDFIARAVFEAFEDFGISYSNPPAGWFSQAQRIRGHRDVLTERAGTCIDTSLIYAACLAQLGIRPLLLLCEGHCLAGYFRLDPDSLNLGAILGSSSTGKVSFSHAEAMKLFEKKLIAQVETTAFTRNDQRDFLDATRVSNVGDLFGANAEKFEFLVDVVAAWRAGITPVVNLAKAVIEEADNDVVEEWLNPTDPEGEDVLDDSNDDLSEAISGAEREARKAARATPPRVRQWMRSLLNLDAGNSLLKVKVKKDGIGKSLVEFEIPNMSLGGLDDALFGGPESLGIAPPTVLPGALSLATPSDEMVRDFVTSKNSLIFPSYSSLATEVKQMLSPESLERIAEKHKITEVEAEELIQGMIMEATQTRLDKAMKKLRDSARKVELETGTNELYLGLGILQWTEPVTSGRQARKKNQVFAAPMFLYPVEIHGGKGTPYSIALDELGSFAPNYCLREKLRRAPHSIDLAQLEFPDFDDSGLNLESLMASVEQQLKAAGLNNFAVRRRAVLGVFNYSNFRLWKDLRDHWQEMTEISAAFRHLVHTPNQPFAAEPVAENERVSPYCPFSADDSQIEAIQWALDGKSFRLEGPPGTGKTQTIANLLSSCLAHDRRVLFVAEKQIALEAVMNKLEARGLAGFCLNLHTDGDSDAKIRAKIKDQIEEALGQNVDPQTVAWDDLTAKSNQLEKELDDYRDGIHTPNGSGHSLWSAQEATLELGEGPAAPIPASLLDTWNQLWPRLRDAASELEHALSVNGPLNKTPWRLVDRPVDEAARSRIRTALLELVHASQDFARLAQAEPSLTSITQPAELAATANIVSLAADGWTATSPNVLTLASASAWKAAADLAVKQLDELIASATQLKTCFSEDVLERLDIAAASAAHAVVVKARWPTRKRKLEAFRVLLGPLLLGDVEAAVSLFPSLITTGSAAAAWRERAAKQLGLLAPPLVGPLRSDATLRFKQALESVSRASTHGQSVSVTWAAEFLNDGRASDAVTVGILHRASMTWHEFVAATMATAKSWSAWANGKTLLQLAESHVAEAANDTTEHRQLRLQRWSNVLVHLEVLRDAGLIVTRDSLLSGELEPSELINAMRRGIVRSTTLERLLAADLDNFDGVMHDRKIQRFAATQSGIRDLLRQRIPGLVIARKQRMALPSGRKVGELQDLLRDLRPRRGRRTPIRDVLEKYGKSLTRLMPVFLMSPDSVATLLPVGAVDFDLVVFDEASQIRVAHAVGALGRGKASVVVGDSKQMPPSTAFMSTETVTEEDSDDSIATTDSQLEEATVSETDESVLNPLENESVEDEDLADEIALNKAESAPDAESILSEFEEAGFPFLQLLCHFRSKDELLIAFSNSEIYEKPMLTFPSPHIAEAGRGNAALRLIQLDGQYERRKGARIENFRNSGETLAMTRTNLVEADAVVAEIRKRIQDPTETERWLKDTQDGHAGSILVVTFNLPQCELILKLLEIAEKETPGLLSHPTAGSYLEKRKITSKTGDVTLIPRVRIQNLEMVQGGEAETVIFSVAFTKEAGSGSNKVPNRFGPISGHNGYRRLNVAATRAQRELIVFCSFDPDTDLIIDETAEPTYGPLLLKKFLLLAKHGQDAYGGVGVALQRSRHLAEIAEFVKSAGFEARMSLGLSLMQVDVAVRDKDARQWQSAILLDGPLWRDRGSAMQRELLPPDALRSLGWQRVIRVWLVDWIQHRADAQRRLVEQLRGKELPAKPEVETAPPRVPEPRDAPSSPPVGGAISAKQVVFSPFVPRVLGTRQRLEQLRDPKVREQMGALFKSILSAEAPIEVHRFTRLVALSFGLERLREQRHKDLLAMVNPKLIEQTELGDFIWLTSRHAAGYVTYRRSSTEQRDLAEVSTVELMNALEDVLLMAGSLTKDEAIREAAVMFGVERLTAGVRQHLEKLVDITVAEARVRVADGRLFPVSTSA